MAIEDVRLIVSRMRDDGRRAIEELREEKSRNDKASEQSHVCIGILI